MRSRSPAHSSTADAVMRVDSLRTSRCPPQRIHLPQPSVQLVPTRENAAHHIFAMSFGKFRLRITALTAPHARKARLILF